MGQPFKSVWIGSSDLEEAQFNRYLMISAAEDLEFGRMTVSERNVGFCSFQTVRIFPTHPAIFVADILEMHEEKLGERRCQCLFLRFNYDFYLH